MDPTGQADEQAVARFRAAAFVRMPEAAALAKLVDKSVLYPIDYYNDLCTDAGTGPSAPTPLAWAFDRRYKCAQSNKNSCQARPVSGLKMIDTIRVVCAGNLCLSLVWDGSRHDKFNRTLTYPAGEIALRSRRRGVRQEMQLSHRRSDWCSARNVPGQHIRILK